MWELLSKHKQNEGAVFPEWGLLLISNYSTEFTQYVSCEFTPIDYFILCIKLTGLVI